VTAYRALVEDPRFLGFFAEVTPIHEIARLNIASRPVRRPGEPTLHNLRAIPWVMSWTQNRANLPGWYGLREGLAAIGVELGREMYASGSSSAAPRQRADEPRQDPTCRSSASTCASAPSRRWPRQLLILSPRRCGWSRRSSAASCSRLSPGSRRSIGLRNPYIDPIHRLQVELLRRARAEPQGLDALERPLLLTVQGIAAGVRNTG
jgi:phosphoenolpyruvate carboxylase